MGVVLLYNLSADKLRRVRTALLRLGIPARTVSPAEYGHPIGWLVGAEGFSPAEEYTGEGFTSEMMVMSGLSSRQFNDLLNTLRTGRAVIRLKAVVTEHNASWDSCELYRALRSEQDTMQEYRAARK